MILESITVIGFTRLLLNHIQSITLTPAEMAQIILGSNGCGKSSLIGEITPLPADPSQYAKNGARITIWRMKGKRFVCKSTFSPTTKHSFVMDGKELNEGGTATVQSQLAFKYFRITQPIHDLMRGREKFCDMSPKKRREWFTLMCPNNYDFAMEAYETILTHQRAVSNTLKLNSKNLVTETAKIVSKAEEERLEKEVNVLINELNVLMTERAPLPKPVAQYANSRDNALANLKDMSMRLLRLKVVAPLEYCDGRMERDDWGDLKRAHFGSLEELDAEINKLKHAITAKETVINQDTDRYNKLHSDYDILLKAGADGVKSLAEKIYTQEEEILSLRDKMRLSLVLPEPSIMQKALESISTGLENVLGSLPANPDRKFGQGRLRELQAKLTQLEDARQAKTNELTKCVAKREHADDHRGADKQTCPKCTHSWVLGINEAQYSILVELIRAHQADLTKLNSEREELLTEIKEIEAYFVQYREFNGYAKSVLVLRPLWDHLLAGNFILESPKEAWNQVRIFERDLTQAVAIEKLDVRLAELNKLKVDAEQMGDVNIAEVKASMDNLATQLGVTTGQLVRLQQSVSDYSDYRRQLVQGMTLGKQVEELYASVHTLQDDYIEATRLESIQFCINGIQQALAGKQESLRNVKTQRAIVANLTTHIQKLTAQEEALKLMVRALSPTHGLIAEGLLGFIRSFVGQMNSFIKKVCTYKLRIIPTGYTETVGENNAELDYKFKFLFEGNSKPVPDVREASDGQVDIINLAFKMTALHYLKLTEAPLFFDEFGRALDEAHRHTAASVLQGIMELHDRTQMFMVSHYISSYSAFANADICVLHADNITLPAKYNQHVIIN